MKGKIVRGAGFRGCLDYVLDPDKKAYIVGGNMAGQDPRTLAREFGHVRRLRPDCKRPVLHIALRLPAGEDVSDAKWLAISLDVLKILQLSNRPWLLVKHLGEHVHLVTSRIDNGGQVWAGKWEALRLIEATQQLERKFGLTITPGLRGRDKKQVRLTSGQLRKIQREVDRGHTPEVPAKTHIAERIEKAIGESDGTFDDFQARLEKLGVTARLNIAKTTNHVSGVTFEFGGITMKGSKVARAYSWQGINQLLAERKDSHENPRTSRPRIEPGPQPDDRRTDQPGADRTGPGTRSVGKRLAGGNIPASPSVPLAVGSGGHGGAGAGADLLLALLARSPVAAAVGAIGGPAGRTPGAVIAAGAKAGALLGRALESCEEDDEPIPEPGDPTMSL
jgi:Relaxase/Mobilisation nuclease domain